MSVEIEVSIYKSDRLKAPAAVRTLDNERPVQWPAKGYRDNTGSQCPRSVSYFPPQSVALRRVLELDSTFKCGTHTGYIDTI